MKLQLIWTLFCLAVLLFGAIVAAVVDRMANWRDRKFTVLGVAVGVVVIWAYVAFGIATWLPSAP